MKKLKGHCILCDINSKEMSSVEFAENLNKIMKKNSTVTFVVGGSYGVSQKVKDFCQQKISFSPMTFPHNLFRIMLLDRKSVV